MSLMAEIAAHLEQICYGDDEAFHAGCASLVGIGAPAVPTLLEAAQQQGLRARYAAFSIFQSLGPAAAPAAPYLMRYVAAGITQDPDDPEGHAVLAAAAALGYMGDARAVPCLIEALAAPDTLANCAALALGDIRDATALVPLIQLLGDHDRSWIPRGASAIALGNFGLIAIMAVPALEQALRYACEGCGEHWDPRAREAAEDAIRRVQDPSTPSSLVGQGQRYEVWGIT